MKTKVRHNSYFLSPTAIQQLREQKKWSINEFGYITTRKYFEDLTQGFQHIADNYQKFPARANLTGESGLSIYPIRENFIVYLPMRSGIHIVAVLGQAQDVPSILKANAATFQRELAGFKNKRI